MSKITGTCKWFNPRKGFGFITRDDNKEDIFVHQTAIYSRGFRSLTEGEKLEFETETSEGKSVAVNVTGENGDFVRGGRAYQEQRQVDVEKLETSLKTAQEDLSQWKEKKFNRDKIQRRLSQLKMEWEKNSIYRMSPEDRLTNELEKSIDYWENKVEMARKFEKKPEVVEK